MRITWKFEADVVKLALKRDDDTDETTAIVTLAGTIDQECATRVFGEPFVRLVFDSRPEAPSLSCLQWRPRAVFERHVVSFSGQPSLRTIPEFDKVEPACLGVRVYLRLPILFSAAATIRPLIEHFADSVSVSIAPEQTDLEEDFLDATRDLVGLCKKSKTKVTLTTPESAVTVDP